MRLLASTLQNFCFHHIIQQLQSLPLVAFAVITLSSTSFIRISLVSVAVLTTFVYVAILQQTYLYFQLLYVSLHNYIFYQPN